MRRSIKKDKEDNVNVDMEYTREKDEVKIDDDQTNIMEKKKQIEYMIVEMSKI